MLSFHKATLLALFVLGCGGATEAPSPNVTTQAGSGNGAGVSDGGAATPSPAPVAAVPLDTSIPAPKITVDDFSGYIDIADDRQDVELRYTLDGSPPTKASTLYTTTFFPQCTKRNAVVTAAAFTTSAMSASTNAPFTQHPFIDGVLFSPIQAHFAVSGQITLTCPRATAIYYTTDGSVPTTASNLYTGPITIDHSFEMAVAGVLGPDGCGDPGGNYTTVAYQFYTVGP